jgi:membrane protein implicated in regulation of membrane protease activity
MAGITAILVAGMLLDGGAMSALLVAVVAPLVLAASVLWRLARRRETATAAMDEQTHRPPVRPFRE